MAIAALIIELVLVMVLLLKQLLKMWTIAATNRLIIVIIGIRVDNRLHNRINVNQIRIGAG